MANDTRIRATLQLVSIRSVLDVWSDLRCACASVQARPEWHKAHTGRKLLTTIDQPVCMDARLLHGRLTTTRLLMLHWSNELLMPWCLRWLLLRGVESTGQYAGSWLVRSLSHGCERRADSHPVVCRKHMWCRVMRVALAVTYIGTSHTEIETGAALP